MIFHPDHVASDCYRNPTSKLNDTLFQYCANVSDVLTMLMHSLDIVCVCYGHTVDIVMMTFQSLAATEHTEFLNDLVLYVQYRTQWSFCYIV